MLGEEEVEVGGQVGGCELFVFCQDVLDYCVSISLQYGCWSD